MMNDLAAWWLLMGVSMGVVVWFKGWEMRDCREPMRLTFGDVVGHLLALAMAVLFWPVIAYALVRGER